MSELGRWLVGGLWIHFEGNHCFQCGDAINDLMRYVLDPKQQFNLQEVLTKFPAIGKEDDQDPKTTRITHTNRVRRHIIALMSDPLKRRFEADDKTVTFFSAVRGNYYSQDLYIEKGTILIAKRGRAQVRPDGQFAKQAATNLTNTGSADTPSAKVTCLVNPKDKRSPFVNELFEVLGWADLAETTRAGETKGRSAEPDAKWVQQKRWSKTKLKKVTAAAPAEQTVQVVMLQSLN